MKTWLLSIAALVLFVASTWIFTNNLTHENYSRTNYQRVVSLAPSLSETMIALKQTHRLVGVTIHCDASEVMGVEKIGSFAEPSFEAIMNLRPDLVLAVPHVMVKTLLDKLKENDIEVFAHQPDTLSDIKFVTHTLANKFGVPKEGLAINQSIDDAIDNARNVLSVSDIRAKKSALVAVSHIPFVVAGHNTFAAEILDKIGFNNMASKNTPWPVWPLERLLSDPPAYLIIAGGLEAFSSFQNIFTSLGLDPNKKHMKIIVPRFPVFHSPSPKLVKDIVALTDLFVADV